jgi:hypothetical protein
MGRVRDDYRVVDVLLAEEPKPELSNILDFAHKRRGEFMLNVKLALRISGFFRWSEIGRTRPNDIPPGANCANNAGLGALGKAARTARPAGVELSIVTVVNVAPSKFQRVQNHVIESKYSRFSKRGFEQPVLPGIVGEPQAGLEIVFVRRASGNDSIPLETCAVRPGVRSTPKRARFIVVPQAVIHRQLACDLPCILDVEAVDCVHDVSGSTLDEASKHRKVVNKTEFSKNYSI